MTLAEIKRMNPMWFGRGNKAFFHDVSYKACNWHGKSYLMRLTYAWTDMFGQPKRLHCRVNKVDAQGKIGNLYPDEFVDYDDARKWIRSKEC